MRKAFGVSRRRGPRAALSGSPGSPRTDRAWNTNTILRAIRALHRNGQSLAPSDVAKHHLSLYNAAFHHWGTYRKAVTAAGLEYDQVLKGPSRWPAETVVAELRRLHRQKRGLSHNLLKRAHPALWSAARRRFGSYRAAVKAAGIRYGDVAQELQRAWTREAVIAAIRRRYREGRPLSHNHVKQNVSKLFSAIHRYFPSFRAGICAAGISYEKIAQVPQERWDKQKVVWQLKLVARGGGKLTRSRMGAKLYGAVWRHFGSIPKALSAASLPRHVLPEPSKPWSRRRTVAELRKLIDSGQRVIRANMSVRLYRNVLRLFGSIPRAVTAAGHDY